MSGGIPESVNKGMYPNSVRELAAAGASFLKRHGMNGCWLGCGLGLEYRYGDDKFGSFAGYTGQADLSSQ